MDLPRLNGLLLSADEKVRCDSRERNCMYIIRLLYLVSASEFTPANLWRWKWYGPADDSVAGDGE